MIYWKVNILASDVCFDQNNRGTATVIRNTVNRKKHQCKQQRYAAFSSHNPINHWTSKLVAENTRYNTYRTQWTNTDITISQGYEVNTLTSCFVIIRQLSKLVSLIKHTLAAIQCKSLIDKYNTISLHNKSSNNTLIKNE